MKYSCMKNIRRMNKLPQPDDRRIEWQSLPNIPIDKYDLPAAVLHS